MAAPKNPNWKSGVFAAQEKARQRLLRKLPVGIKIGLRIVLGEAQKIDGKDCFYVKTKCECGSIDWVLASYLIRGKLTACVNCSRHRNSGSQRKDWTGYKDMSGTLFGRIRDKAKVRSIDFELSKKYIRDLLHEQTFQCTLTGISLTWKTASLDRIDSSQGYIDGNVQWVTKKVNLAKHKLKQNEFIDLCRLVVEHNL